MEKTNEIILLGIIIVLLILIIYLVCDFFVQVPKIAQKIKEKYVVKIAKPKYNNAWETSKNNDESEMFDFTLA